MLRDLRWFNILVAAILVTAGILCFWYPQQALVVALSGIGFAVLGSNVA